METDAAIPWWQRHRKIIWILVTLLLSAGCVTFVICAYIFRIEWTGFNASQGPNVQQYQPTKTLWDWLQLLFIPVALVIAAYWLNRENSLTEQRESNKRDQTARAVALDNQQEALLQDYLDRMSDLLLEHNLGGSDTRSEVKSIARARTLTVLSRLDKRRKGSLIQFLYESHLISSNAENRIQLRNADLSEADMSGFDLSGVDLCGADLSRADLSRANLSEAQVQEVHLCHATLSGTILRGANLHRANLSSAILHGASFEGARLTHAQLIEASLSRANFARADLSDALVNGAKRDHTLLENAIISQVQLKKMLE